MLKKVKLKKCKVCKSEFQQFVSTQIACGYECALIYVKQQTKKEIEKKKQAEKKENMVQKKKFYDNDKRHQLKLTQKSFNKLRKLQELKWFSDKGVEPECISCGKKNMDWACGHYKTVGSQGWLRFDMKNTYLQCNRYCNMALSGNISGNKNTRGFTQGLIDRFGEKESSLIFDYCSKDNSKKWGCEELIEMRASFNQQIRKLEAIIKELT